MDDLKKDKQDKELLKEFISKKQDDTKLFQRLSTRLEEWTTNSQNIIEEIQEEIQKMKDVISKYQPRLQSFTKRINERTLFVMCPNFANSKFFPAPLKIDQEHCLKSPWVLFLNAQGSLFSIVQITRLIVFDE